MLHKPRTRIEIDIKGRQRTLMETRCRVCVVCWVYVDTGTCIFGGPFSGYRAADPNDPPLQSDN